MHDRAQGLPEAAAGVEVALRRTRLELRRLVWQAVLVPSGLWTAAMVCAVSFAAELADALADGTALGQSPGATRWNPAMVWKIRSGLGRAARRCEQTARGWQHQAARLDQRALQRRLASDDPGRDAVMAAVPPPGERSSSILPLDGDTSKSS